MRRPASRAAFANCRLLRQADAVGRRLHAEVADLGRVAHGVEEDRRDGRLAAGELHRHLPPRLDGQRIVQQPLHVVERQLVDVADLIRVHEARVAHHVAAVGQVDRQDRAAPVLDRGRAVVVQRVGDRIEVPAGEETLDPAQEIRIDGERVGERAVLRTGLLDDDLAVALDDVGLDLADVLVRRGRRWIVRPREFASSPRARRLDRASRSSSASPTAASNARRSS